MSAALDHYEDDFSLSAEPETPALELEAEPFAGPDQQGSTKLQAELYLPHTNPESPPPDPQIELAGMSAPAYRLDLSDGRHLRFQHAASLLESLEAQNIDMHYQCREGYCGSCRVQLLEGEVHYNSEPMAWLNQDEILTCCCIPKTHLKIKL